MNIQTTMMAGCALALIGMAAQANCADELAMFAGDGAAASTAEGISKDGSLAPLEEPQAANNGTDATVPDNGGTTGGIGLSTDTAKSDSGDSATSAATAGLSGTTEGDGIAKDGSLAPLEEEAGGNTDITAMSGRDAETQQEGEPTAAAEASAPGDNAPGTPGDDATTTERNRTDLIARANDALAAGDEEACMEAVNELKAM